MQTQTLNATAKETAAAMTALCSARHAFENAPTSSGVEANYQNMVEAYRRCKSLGLNVPMQEPRKS